ncbi:GntR family transcriptional regulator [Kibdelosporangium philippinense]|uniref:GntR family transcriptional regulator n=1 Tax=Kibdelosporangium philippinense TaxID=211113 RepID=A0ABS8Z3J1_9PSEU|nr:GntR family transcriptional regulator [Kibdelosporangium philippinense]MCE7002494.1 GntR family transcriptional regulator [Kibdelosporangium philippinense]
MAKTGTGKYEPVLADIREQISNGTLQPGAWLPSESGLMQHYGLSRYTVREAIRRLAGDGLIVVVDGKGSYVRPRSDRAAHNDTRAVYTHSQPDGTDTFTDAETPQWHEIETPGTYRTNATVDLALALGVPEHTPLFVHDRLLSTSDTPAGASGRRMTHRTYIPMPTCTRVQALADNPFRTPDELYAALTDAGITPQWTESVRATIPAPDDTTALHVPVGSAVLITRRTTTDTDGRPLLLEETRRSAHDTQLTYPLAPIQRPA